ncbi:MAG TPA: hypothetical protein VG621_03795 [Candidatus Paceibacterota bacterium]|nr:hypothetical protein [Candidatus Paceibacterota bacterium]
MPFVAYADGADDLIFKINKVVINPAIEFAFIVALVVFLWGVMEYIRGANNEDKRKTGRQHMLWGIVGFLIMLGVFGIINIVLGTFGIKGATINNQQQTFQAPQLQELKYPQVNTTP